MAEKRQVDGAQVGLQQNFGIGGAAVVTLYRKYTTGNIPLRARLWLAFFLVPWNSTTSQLYLYREYSIYICSWIVICMAWSVSTLVFVLVTMKNCFFVCFFCQVIQLFLNFRMPTSIDNHVTSLIVFMVLYVYLVTKPETHFHTTCK